MVTSTVAYGEGWLTEDQYKSLKRLPQVSVLVNPPDDYTPALTTTLDLGSKSLGDWLTVSLAKAIPALKLSDL